MEGFKREPSRNTPLSARALYARGPPLRGRLPRVALQRHARRGRRQARDLHEEVPGGQFVCLKMWCDTRISPETLPSIWIQRVARD